MQSYKKNGKMLRRALAFVFWGVLAACPAAAQRVGVVMSGGGTASVVASAEMLLPFTFKL